MNDKSAYRVIKLVNGQDIIGEIVESTSKALSIFRPFEMKVLTLSENENSLFQTELLLMRNWLKFSEELKGIIAKTNIILVSKPKDSIIKCYEEEKKKEDDPNYISDRKQELLNELEENNEETEEYEIMIDPESIEQILYNILKNKSFNIKDINDGSEEESSEEDFKETKETTDDQDTDHDMFGY